MRAGDAEAHGELGEFWIIIGIARLRFITPDGVFTSSQQPEQAIRWLLHVELLDLQNPGAAFFITGGTFVTGKAGDIHIERAAGPRAVIAADCVNMAVTAARASQCIAQSADLSEDVEDE